MLKEKCDWLVINWIWLNGMFDGLWAKIQWNLYKVKHCVGSQGRRLFMTGRLNMILQKPRQAVDRIVEFMCFNKII